MRRSLTFRPATVTSQYRRHAGHTFTVPPPPPRVQQQHVRAQIQEEEERFTQPTGNPIVVVSHRGVGAVELDTTMPLVTAKELHDLALPLMVASTLIPYRPNRPTPRFLIDNFELETQGIPEWREYDILYRNKGYVAPSEVLHAVCKYVPTFFVELRYVLNGIPDALKVKWFEGVLPSRDGRYLHALRVFQWYPMIFKIDKNRFQLGLLKLNSESSAPVRTHPDCGSANKDLRRVSKEFSANRGVLSRERTRLTSTVSANDDGDDSSSTPDIHEHNNKPLSPVSSHDSAAVPRHRQLKTLSIDTQVLSVLVAHLPRGARRMADSLSANESWRYRPVPITEWISSLSGAERSVINEVPQRRVIVILCRYRRIFQLCSADGSDPQLFHPRRDAIIQHRRSSDKPLLICGEESTTPEVVVESSSLATPTATVEVHDDHKETTINNNTATIAEEETDILTDADSDQSPPLTAEDTERRVKAFQTAVADELIGLDDFVSSNEPLVESFDRGDGDATKDDDESIDDAAAVDMRGGDDESNIVKDEPEELSRAQIEGRKRESGGTPVRNEGRHESNDDGEGYVPTALQSVYIRRLPPDIAPGSLSDLDEETSPDPRVLEHVMTFLQPPLTVDETELKQMQPRQRFGWRWVLMDHIYKAIPLEQRSRLRPFKGLPNFLRLHGRLFEVSPDARYVIAHDGKGGRLPPLIPTERLFSEFDRACLPLSFDNAVTNEDAIAGFLLHGERERTRFRNVLGDSQIPITRFQLELLDPINPMLCNDFLIEEIKEFLPDHPVHYMQLVHKLPPIMRAALPKDIRKLLEGCLHTWKDETGRLLFSKTPQSTPTTTSSSREGAASEVWSLTKSLAWIEAKIPLEGISIGRLNKLLPTPAEKAIARETSCRNLLEVLRMVPERFRVETTVVVDGFPPTTMVYRTRDGG